MNNEIDEVEDWLMSPDTTLEELNEIANSED